MAIYCFFFSVDLLTRTASSYNDALSNCNRSRRVLTRNILYPFACESWISHFRAVGYKEFWTQGDFECIHIVREIDAEGGITDLVFIMERYLCLSHERSLYWLQYDDGSIDGTTPKYVMRHESKRMTFAMPSDENSPQALVKQILLFVGPRNAPPSISPRPIFPSPDTFLYSGHQTEFFFIGLPPTLRRELDACDEPARKRHCVPPTFPVYCAICQEAKPYYLVYKSCGHAVCCTQCLDDFFHIDRRRFLAAHLCPTCRAVFPADMGSRLLQLDAARTSHTLDREMIFRSHRRLDALSTTCAHLYCDQMMVPSLAELFDLDQQDDADRDREGRGYTLESWATTTARNFRALNALCALLFCTPTFRKHVVEYVAYGSACFYGVRDEALLPPTGEEDQSGWRYSLVQRRYRPDGQAV